MIKTTYNFLFALLGVLGVILTMLWTLNLSANDAYYSPIKSVKHGLDSSFRKLLQSCGAEASLIMELQYDAENRGALEDQGVRNFLTAKGHFGESIQYCLDAKLKDKLAQ